MPSRTIDLTIVPSLLCGVRTPACSVHTLVNAFWQRTPRTCSRPDTTNVRLSWKLILMHLPARVLLLLLGALGITGPLPAQLPFYTDDPAVTERGKWHFEFFNEFDALQRPQYPNLRQNTANYKLNYGLPYNLELDVDAPYLAIFRAVGTQTATGAGDVNMGIKWNFHKESQGSRLPALGVSLYIEFPTADASQQLGSGLAHSWLKLVARKGLFGE